MKSWKAGMIHDGYVIRTVKCPLCGEKTRTTFPAHGKMLKAVSSLEDYQVEADERISSSLAWIGTICVACGGLILLGTWMEKDAEERQALSSY